MKQAFLLLLLILTLLLSVSVRADDNDDNDQGDDDDDDDDDHLEIHVEDSYNEVGFGNACGTTATGLCTPDMFCAADGVCHLRTCENFYRYAPDAWTGRHQDQGAPSTTSLDDGDDDDNDDNDPLGDQSMMHQDDMEDIHDTNEDNTEDDNDEEDDSNDDNEDDTEDNNEADNTKDDNDLEDDTDDDNEDDTEDDNDDDDDDEDTTQRGELECYINEFPDTVEPPCRDPEGKPVFPVAVHYSCHEDSTLPQTDGIQCPEWDDIARNVNGSGGTRRQFATANRVCTAKPNPEQRFVCYDMAPNTNLTAYFETYGAAIESCDGCDADAESTGSTACGSNGHQITSHLTAVTSTGNMADSTFLPVVDGNMGDSFDPSLVGARSINTMLLSEPQTTATTSPGFDETGTQEMGSSSPQPDWSFSRRIFPIISVTMILAWW
jgi:hypothetical protein